MQIEQKTNRIYKPQSNTTLSAEETNQVTTELENVITAGGLTPNAGTLTQVRDAVQAIVDTSANELQEQIDAIVSASDVFDVVGTYAQLQAYDTSTVPTNDIIKVLQDETRDDAMTYYRWNGTSWVFIGAEGPYYTVAETDIKFATKAQLPGVATTTQVGLIKPDGTTTLVAQDGTLTVSQTVLAALPLFTHHFVDHLLNDASYLRADTFSWHSGSVYVSAYQHLVDDITGVTAETETISGTTIAFYRATDGHKVVLANQESNVAAIMAATGVAWYYILDTANTRFKLPRSTWAFVGLRNTVGKYVEESLPDGALTLQLYNESGATTDHIGDGGNTTGVSITTKLSDYNSVFKTNAPVQQRATQMYLYFYAGNTVQGQTAIDVGQITEDLNGKADLDLANLNNAGKIVAAKMSMPGNTYTELSLGAAGSTYTAPADGYFVLNKTHGANTSMEQLSFINYGSTSGTMWTDGLEIRHLNSTSGMNSGIYMPAKQGDKVQVHYSFSGATLAFRFYYAVGAE